MFNIYEADRGAGGVSLRRRLNLRLGHSYPQLGLLVPELFACPDRKHDCGRFHLRAYQSLPGKLMAYEALGAARAEWAALIRRALLSDQELVVGGLMYQVQSQQYEAGIDRPARPSERYRECKRDEQQRVVAHCCMQQRAWRRLPSTESAAASTRVP